MWTMRRSSAAVSSSRSRGYVWIFLFALIMWAAGNVLLYEGQTSAYKEETDGATLSDLVSSFGLESGEEYPIVIGDKTAVDSGQVSYGGGMFYVKGEGQWTSSTSILVAFEGDNGSYILEGEKFTQSVLE